MKKPFIFITTTILLGFMACDDIIEVVDISKETVTILAPTASSTVDSTQVVFTWQPIEDAENYHLQVATPAFGNATQVVLDTLIAKSSFTKTLETKDYEWRVRAENSGYLTTYTTTGFRVEE